MQFLNWSDYVRLALSYAVFSQDEEGAWAVEVPGLAETRVLVVIDKVSQTPDGYPRGRGLPRKQPLGCEENPDCAEEMEG